MLASPRLNLLGGDVRCCKLVGFPTRCGPETQAHAPGEMGSEGFRFYNLTAHVGPLRPPCLLPSSLMEPRSNVGLGRPVLKSALTVMDLLGRRRTSDEDPGSPAAAARRPPSHHESPSTSPGKTGSIYDGSLGLPSPPATNSDIGLPNSNDSLFAEVSLRLPPPRTVWN
jgi:hypothetical protein